MANSKERKHLVFSDIDLNSNGRQVGFFYVSHSPDDDAWGTVQVPIAVLKNGSGPTVLLEGGNHGDEYEGPIALGELIREIDLSSLNGRLIIIPAINQPAVTAGKRTSSIDGLNFNRSFPGDPGGSVTQQIAAYVHDVLMPMSDAFISLHSGGSSLDIIPSSIFHTAGEPGHTERNFAAAAAFGAPVGVLLDNLGDTRTAASAAMSFGLTTVSVEMAGQGTVSPEALNICRAGITNVLTHLCALVGNRHPSGTKPDSLYQVPGAEAYVISNHDGVFEPFFALGDTVRKGQAIGRVHFITDPRQTPIELCSKCDGIVFAKRQPGRVRPGNCCAVIAEKVSRK